MKYKITAPNRAYNGISAGVHFVEGSAITENEDLIDWFRSKGYTVQLMDNQPFIACGEEVGKVEGEYINVTDTGVIKETLEESIKEIRKMKSEQLNLAAKDLEVDISNCKNVEEKKEAIISFMTGKSLEIISEMSDDKQQEQDNA